METVESLLSSTLGQKDIAGNRIFACISACFECELACVACADACLEEADLDPLRACIRLDLDTADICAATGRVLARQVEPNDTVVKALVDACAQACAACAAECDHHDHDHCRICAAACRKCEAACREILGD